LGISDRENAAPHKRIGTADAALSAKTKQIAKDEPVRRLHENALAAIGLFAMQ
jgi:hypothetical protein